MSSGKPEAQLTTPRVDATSGAGTKRKNPPDTPTMSTVPPAKVKAPRESSAVSDEVGLDAVNKLTAEIDDFRIQLQEISVTVIRLTRLQETHRAEMKENKDKVRRLERETIRLTEENQELKGNMLELERHKRRWNLKLTGLKEKDGECTRDAVVEILSRIDPQLSPSMETVVDAVGRLGRRKEGRTRPVIMRFTSRRHRDAMWKLSRNSKTCKELGIRCKRDFCRADREARAAVLPKMKKARAEGQRVFYRGHAGYINGVRVEVKAAGLKHASLRERSSSLVIYSSGSVTDMFTLQGVYIVEK